MRKIKIFICAGIFLAVAAIFSYYLYNTSTLLAEVHKNIKETGMIASSLGFSLGEKDAVKISVKSSVDEGSALITLQNENGEILHTFDTNYSQKETISLEAGNYDIRIDSDKFNGKFDIVVRK